MIIQYKFTIDIPLLNHKRDEMSDRRKDTRYSVFNVNAYIRVSSIRYRVSRKLPLLLTLDSFEKVKHR